jgi:hypothetical protein
LFPLVDRHSVWNYEQKRARFVEVKGPGDRLSSTQQVRRRTACPSSTAGKGLTQREPISQVWLDVLIGAGVEAEVCKVVEAGNEGLRSMSRSVSPVKRRLASVAGGEDDDESETTGESDRGAGGPAKKRRPGQ